jgi:hypothetical protein
VAWQPPVELASGPGERGPWQQNDSAYAFVDDPAVAFAGDGALLLAWVDQQRKAVLVQRRSAQAAALGPAVPVDRDPQRFSWLPRLAVPPDDPATVLVLWQEIIFSGGSHGGEMLLARSTDGGRSFTPPLNLSSSTGGDGKGRITPQVWHNGSCDLLAMPGGAVLATWTEYDGPLWASRSSDGGRTFSRPLQLAGGGRRPAARAPSLALAPDGTVWLAWTEGSRPGADLQLARSGDGGRTFDRPRAVAPSPAFSDAPSLAVDARGVLHLAWAESGGGPFEAHRIQITRSADGGRSFEAPRVLTPTLPAPFVGAGYPVLAVDRSGTVLVACELFEHPRQRSRGIALLVSADGGSQFGEPAVVPGSVDPDGGFNGSTQGLLMKKLALGPGGRVALVNSSLLEGRRSRVWLLPGRLAR